METTHALIIDDDTDTANLFKTILELVGFECHAAFSAKMALAYLAMNDPDIVLLDMRLGLELDGQDILYQIRSNTRFDKTRVIVITAYPGMLERVNDLADLIMLKPVEVEDLLTLASRLAMMRPKSYLFRDPVSNLYTKVFFMTRLEHAYERSKRCPDFCFGTMAIQFSIDLKGEERLQEEDQGLFLKQIAGILNKDFRPTDTFGHLEGLRIAALCEDLKKPDDISVIMQRLHKDLTRTIEVKGHTWHITPTIGAVLNDSRFKNPDEILKTALNALELALQETDKYFLVADPFPA
jgi:CheY-like chemotaxis protein